MKETGIIMSGDHPKLILDDIKTMTRRTWGLEKINQDPDTWKLVAVFQDGLARFARVDGTEEVTLRCPYGGYGDRLWVKETCKIQDFGDYKGVVAFKTTINPDPSISNLKWTPSVFMPRWASRIEREITEVRVQRLQEITDMDCEKEGLDNPCGYYCDIAVGHVDHQGTINNFAQLWDSLNAKRGYSWQSNPWVWVISFKKVKNASV